MSAVVSDKCPRCGEPDPERRFYGPCPRCVGELVDWANRRRVWHFILGLVTHDGWHPKTGLSPAEWDEIIRKHRASPPKRTPNRRARR